MEANARAWRRAAGTGQSVMQQAPPQQHPPEPNEAFLYEALDSGLRVRLASPVVDRLVSEALRGLSALPRRGLEVGGLLLGSAAWSGGVVEICVDEVAAFSCEHLYGPNFQLSPKDREGFAALLSSWAPSPGRRIHPVGFYRSHTRGDLELAAEDIELLDTWLTQPHALCLLIRPYLTRPAEAAFFFRQQGVFQPGRPSSTFLLRRPAPGRGSSPWRAEAASQGPPAPVQSPQPPDAQPEARATPVETPIQARPAQSGAGRIAGSWLLVLLLVTFLMVGIVIGVQLALVLRTPQESAATTEPYALGLSALQVGEAIHLRWKPQAPALAVCRSASLIIRDGPSTKILDLRKEDLARGALIYRHSSPMVSFRMEAILSPANTVSETIDLRLMPVNSGPGADSPDPLQ